MNMALEFSTVSKSAHLTPEQTEEFGRRVEQIRQDVMQSLGEQDAKYIYKVRNFVRYTEIASRGMLMFGGWIPPVWLLGTGLLGISKIVENMELGHNVMHGQFDWLNEPSLNGNTYDWDTIASVMTGVKHITMCTTPIPILSVKTMMSVMAFCE